jgi:hypothetical protein
MQLDQTEKTLLKIFGAVSLGFVLWCGGARVGYLHGQADAQRDSDAKTQDVVGVRLPNGSFQMQELHEGLTTCAKADIKRSFDRALAQKLNSPGSAMIATDVYREVVCNPRP